MDDIVILGSNKRKLHQMKESIITYLKQELNLELKSNYQVFRFDYIKNKKHYGREIDFMGFRFFRNKTTLRKSILHKAISKARKMNKKEKPTIYDCQQFISYMSWIDATDTYNFYLKNLSLYTDENKSDFFLKAPVLAMALEMSDPMKTYQTMMNGMIPYLIAFLVGLVAFWKAWQLLLSQLRKA